MTGPGTYDYDPDSWRIHPPWDEDEAAWLQWVEEMPLSNALGIRAVELADGKGIFCVDDAPLGIPNPNGSIHGGLVIAIADQMMGCVGMTVLEKGLVLVTASLHSQYYRPAMAPATFRGEVTKHGRSLVFVHIDCLDEAGRVCNSAQGTMMPMRAVPRT